uniref:ANK_REP_REGION domain-containing protein n=1 Tax=Rhabditophanes sp. KR3021 TaxID=114890 RepID=A0AC35U9H0_9BILA
MSRSEGPPKPLPKPGRVQVFKATKSYIAKNEQELSISEGQIVFAPDSTVKKDYVSATVDGIKGLIPRDILTSENVEMVKFPLNEAAKRGNLQFFQNCLDNGVSPNALDKSGSTPLYWASHSGNYEIVKLLLARGNVDLNNRNKLGDTCLHACVWKNHGDIVEMLVEAGADVHIKNNDNLKPIDLAKDQQIAAFLLLFMNKKAEKAEIDEVASSDEDC